jgi:hypothetical protein
MIFMKLIVGVERPKASTIIVIFYASTPNCLRFFKYAIVFSFLTKNNPLTFDRQLSKDKIVVASPSNSDKLSSHLPPI